MKRFNIQFAIILMVIGVLFLTGFDGIAGAEELILKTIVPARSRVGLTTVRVDGNQRWWYDIGDRSVESIGKRRIRETEAQMFLDTSFYAAMNVKAGETVLVTFTGSWRGFFYGRIRLASGSATVHAESNLLHGLATEDDRYGSWRNFNVRAIYTALTDGNLVFRLGFCGKDFSLSHATGGREVGNIIRCTSHSPTVTPAPIISGNNYPVGSFVGFAANRIATVQIIELE